VRTLLVNGTAAGLSIALGALIFAAGTAVPKDILTGEKAFEDATRAQPGMFRRITASDLPQPYATKSAFNTLKIIPRPADAWPKAPPGFKVELYADGLSFPRLIRRAPNGDIFLADAPNHSQNNSGTIKVLRGLTKDGKPEKNLNLYFRFEYAVRHRFLSHQPAMGLYWKHSLRYPHTL
jgi:hypothetical protein